MKDSLSSYYLYRTCQHSWLTPRSATATSSTAVSTLGWDFMFSCVFVSFLCFFCSWAVLPPRSLLNVSLKRHNVHRTQSKLLHSMFLPARKMVTFPHFLPHFEEVSGKFTCTCYCYIGFVENIESPALICPQAAAKCWPSCSEKWNRSSTSHTYSTTKIARQKNKCQSEAIVTVSGYYPPLVTTWQFDKFTHPDWLVNSSEPAKARYPDGFDRSNASDKVVNIIVLCDQIFLRWKWKWSLSICLFKS